MPLASEPICARITPPGYAAIHVLRISGSGSVGIVAQFFKPRQKLLKCPSHRVVYGVFHNREGIPLDQVLCTVFRAPSSYTGEESVEISCHGNPRLSAAILESLLTEARIAHPGEFTLRALLNGKLDLTQAEAVNDLVHATGSKAETAALMQVQGVLSKHLQQLLDAITDTRLRCELAIDFADQDLPALDQADLVKRIGTLLDQARSLHSDGCRGRFIREGIRICLAGAPNSGKSSLFNAFLQQNRAIVTPHPGTTRDYLEESVSLEGYTLILFDTAGLRDSDDQIEKEGISRSRELMRSADLIIYLLPVDQAPDREETAGIAGSFGDKLLWLASKHDLLEGKAKLDTGIMDGSSPDKAIPVSVLSGGGMGALYQAILNRFMLPKELLDRPLITNARHLAALEKAVAALEKAHQSLEDGAGYEFTAFDLIAASKALEEILGIVTTEDLLGKIFSNFCIGK